MKKQLVRAANFLVLLSGVSSIFYSLAEGWNLFDSFYFTITTISTVGYGDIYPVTFAGKAYTIFLILAGVSLFLHTLTSVARAELGKWSASEGRSEKAVGRKIKSGFALKRTILIPKAGK